MHSLILNILYILILTTNISIIIYNVGIIKIPTKNILIFNTILFIVSFILDINKQSYLLIPISTILIIIYLFATTKIMYYSIALSVFTQLVFLLGDAFTGFILVFAVNINYSEILNNPKIQLVTYLIILLVCYPISKFAKIFFEKIYFSNFFKSKLKNVLIFTFCLLLTLTSIYLYSIFLKNSFNSFGVITIVLNLFFSLSFLILIIVLTQLNNENTIKSLEKDYNKKELSILKEYTDMLENVSNDLRKFKHDYINIIQIMDAYISSEDIKGLKNFYEHDLMPESKKILGKDICFMLLRHIKIDPLKGLISSKIISAQSKDIKIKIDIIEDIKELSINSLDICRIIGIFLDNAIEGTELCANKFIDLLIFKNENSTTIIISNSCHENTSFIFKLHVKNFSTKGPNRGIGLKFVREIIDMKYSNVLLNTKINNSVFSQELVLINNSNTNN